MYIRLVILGLAVSMPAMGQTVFSCGFEEGETGYELSAIKAIRGDASDVMTIVDGGSGHFSSHLDDYNVDCGTQYLLWQSAGKDSDVSCKADESFLCINGLDLKDNTSYRCTFYIKTDTVGGKVQIGVYHGSQDRHSAVKSDWETGEEIIQELSGIGKFWTRVSFVFFYRTDAYYKEIISNLEDSDFIRFSFMGPGRSYSIDAISVAEEPVPSVYYEGNTIMVDFGYETNIMDFDASTVNSMKECFSLSGTSTFSGNLEECPIVACEPAKTNNGIMVFTGGAVSDYTDAKLTFRNSDPSLPQLKYTDAGYPNPDDSEWIATGKIIPDFECTNLRLAKLTNPIPWTPTGIQVPVAASSSDVRHLDMLGRSVTPDAPGLHIVLRSDGSAKKVLVR